MKLKRIGALLSSLALLGGLLAVPASAVSTADGVYTAQMVTSYYNPDTGNVDDGGTANAALGEGMCRSATDRTCLVEVDGDDVWITVRLLLQSNCSNVALYTRSGYDSYSQVSYDVMAEDVGSDSIDYRIKVSDVDQKLKCTMYVSPMGRDVLWYLYVDTSTLTAGSGDFVVSIDTSANSSVATETPAPASSTPSGGTASSGTTSNPTTSTPTSTAPSANPSPQGAGSDDETSVGSADAPEDTPEPAETEEPLETDAPEDGEAVEETEVPEESEDPEPSPTEGVEDEDAPSENSGGSILPAVLAVVLLAAVVAVIFIVKRKLRK